MIESYELFFKATDFSLSNVSRRKVNYLPLPANASPASLLILPWAVGIGSLRFPRAFKTRKRNQTEAFMQRLYALKQGMSVTSFGKS